MAEIEIGAKVLGIEKIETALKLLESRAVRKKPLMRKLGAAMVGIVDRNFEAEGRPSKWKTRSPISQANLAIGAQNRARSTKRYEKAKQRGRASILRAASLKQMSNKILSGSGELKNSITYDAQEDKVYTGPAGARPYARIHNLGGVIRPKTAKALLVPCGKRLLRLKSVTIPKREYLTVPASAVPALAAIAAAYLQEGVRP